MVADIKIFTDLNFSRKTLILSITFLIAMMISFANNAPFYSDVNAFILSWDQEEDHKNIVLLISLVFMITPTIVSSFFCLSLLRFWFSLKDEVERIEIAKKTMIKSGFALLSILSIIASITGWPILLLSVSIAILCSFTIALFIEAMSSINYQI